MNKILCIDLDKTFLDDNGEISEINKKAIDLVIKHNWIPIIVTGKPFLIAKKYYKKLNLKTPMVCSLGQIVYQDQKIIYSSFLKNESNLLKEKIIKDFIAIDINQNIFVTNSKYLNLFQIKINNNSKLINKKITDLIIILKSKNNIEYLKNKYKKLNFIEWPIFGQKIIIVRVINKNIDKFITLKRILKTYKKRKVNLTFGDGKNDIPIFKISKLAIAMKNSDIFVKSEAHKITEFDNNNSGVGKEIIKLFKS